MANSLVVVLSRNDMTHELRPLVYLDQSSDQGAFFERLRSQGQECWVFGLSADPNSHSNPLGVKLKLEFHVRPSRVLQSMEYEIRFALSEIPTVEQLDAEYKHFSNTITDEMLDRRRILLELKERMESLAQDPQVEIVNVKPHSPTTAEGTEGEGHPTLG